MEPAPLAPLPVALVRVPVGRADVAGDGPLHELHDPHARARLLGAGDDAGRRLRARPRPREATQPVLATLHGPRLPRLGRRLPDPRTERLALRALGVPAPSDRLDACRWSRVPAASRLPAPRGPAQ